MPTPRVCPAQGLAINSIYLIISNVLASYTIAKPLDEHGNEFDPEVEYIGVGNMFVVLRYPGLLSQTYMPPWITG